MVAAKKTVARRGQIQTAEPDESEEKTSRYRAPALEKGLDVIELLVTETRPLTMSEICSRLRRSQGEMFRMVQVLQGRGFLIQDSATDGYYLTDLLFTLGMRQPPTQGLVEIAIPKMRALANEIGQSCHLALYARGEIVIVARMESSEQIGFSVRVGYRRSIAQAVSGTVLFGFQPPDVQAIWLRALPSSVTKGEVDDLFARADAARKDGFVRAGSYFVPAVTDISVPVMRGDRAAAALTVPFLQHANVTKSMSDVTNLSLQTAKDISAQLVDGDSRA